MLQSVDVGAARKAAEEELRKEIQDKAIRAIKAKLKDLENAKQVVKNLEREVQDLEASINDGSFKG
jgi:hypothetical protein